MWAIIKTFAGSIFSSANGVFMALGAGLIAVSLGYVAYLKHEINVETSARTVAEAKLSQEVAANKVNQQTIDTLSKVRASENAILLQLKSSLDGINSATEKTNAQLDRLAETNIQVKDFLSTKLPADLQRMLNGP